MPEPIERQPQDELLTSINQKMKFAGAILAVVGTAILLTMPELFGAIWAIFLAGLVAYGIRRNFFPAKPSKPASPGTQGLWLENQRREKAEAQQREIEARRQAAARITANADRAITRAENRLAATPFWLEDVGLLLYNDADNPTISREEAVCAAGAHLRPYIILNCPYSMDDTKLTVSFSLWDDQEQLVYATQVRQPLSGSGTLLTPQTWVQIPDAPTAGKWTLRVSVKGYGVLAVHEFKWWRGDQELHFTSDGEIDSRIVELLTHRLAEPVEDEAISLDELLAQQKGDV